MFYLIKNSSLSIVVIGFSCATFEVLLSELDTVLFAKFSEHPYCTVESPEVFGQCFKMCIHQPQ